METLENIKSLLAEMEVDANKFYQGNDAAGTRSRQSAQKIKTLLQDFRNDVTKTRSERKGK